MPENVKHIAIIGAGASGTLTAIQLLRKLNHPTRIYLIEKRTEAVCRGTAYSSKLEYEPLNVQAGRMSAFNHLPDNFFQWVLANRTTDITPDSFVSRRWYGDYLTETFNQYKTAATHAQVEIVVGVAESIKNDELQNCYIVAISTGEKIKADYVVFATGNEVPQDIFSQQEIEQLGEKYITNPWFIYPFAAVKETDDILIAGTGLTSVDHIVSLHRRGHKGRIYCFSRNGYLPLPHNDVVNYTFDGSFEQKNLKQVFALVRSSMQKAIKQNINWQSVIDALRPRVTRIWRNLSADEKRFFLRKLKTQWEIHRHRMPQTSHQIVTQLQQDGRLQIINGAYSHVIIEGNQVTFNWRNKGEKELKSAQVNLILNCTGPSGDYKVGSNALIKNMLATGWMKQDELKIGIETGIRGEIIMGNGVVLNKCYAVGPLRKASEWEDTAIREIRTQAENVATNLADKIGAMHDVLVDI